MFILKTVLIRSLNNRLLASNLVISRWTSTSTKEKEDKNQNEGVKKNKVIEQQEEAFKAFTEETGLTLEDKQDKFLDMLFRFKDQNVYNQRLGDCEFVLGSLKILKPLGLHKDIEIYKHLMSVFPKEKMKTENYFQQLGTFYPKHQETAIILLEEMGLNNVMPDKEMRIIVRDIFGGLSDVHRKVLSMNYWNSKLVRKTPFPIPDRPITDQFELAKLALKKMCFTVDPGTKLQKYDSSVATMDKESNEWILTAQSNSQKELIKRLNEIVYIEGPFTCFVQHEKSVKYFVLKTNTPNPFEFVEEKRKLDVSRMKISTFGRKEVLNLIEEKIKLHMQEDGSVLATCITEKSTEKSVLAWVRILCKLNENLENLQIVFNLKVDNERDKSKK